MRSDKPRRIAFDAAFAGCALMLTFVESVIPIASLVPIPGFRLGLANIALMACAFFLGRADAAAVAAVKITVSAILFSTPTAFLYSLAGTLLSLAGLILIVSLRRIPFSITGISVLCAALHNVGQAAVSVAFFGKAALSVLPYLLVVSILSGIVTGAVMTLLAAPLEKLITNGGIK